MWSVEDRDKKIKQGSYKCKTNVAEWIRKGLNIRDIRSKLLFSSGLCFTWQVSRLSLAGGRLACRRERDEAQTGKECGEKNHTNESECCV